MDEVHFAPLGNHGSNQNVVGILQGNRIIPGLLRWCEVGFVHKGPPTYFHKRGVDSSGLNHRGFLRPAGPRELGIQTCLRRTRRVQSSGLWDPGFFPHSCDTRDYPLYVAGLCPFFLYHRSGFRFPQPWFKVLRFSASETAGGGEA